MFQVLIFRMYLAVLHINENSNCQQAVNAQGQHIFTISYPKGRTSTDGVAKSVKVPQTFGE